MSPTQALVTRSPERVIFLVDGFNVYWSIHHALQNKKISHGKWLDHGQLGRLCLANVMDFPRGAVLSGVHYFSAYAGFREATKPGTVARHKLYVKALKASGVEVTMGRYKSKKLKCKASCKQSYLSQEEKETDVNLAVYLLDYLGQDLCDTIVPISGYTDLLPALKMARRRFPSKRLAVGFPNNRNNNSLEPPNSDFSFKIHASAYQACQFPYEVLLPCGTKIHRPPNW